MTRHHTTPGVGSCMCDADEHAKIETKGSVMAKEPIVVGRDVELPGLGDGSKYRGTGKEDGQRNLECLKNPSFLSPWSFCGIWDLLGATCRMPPLTGLRDILGDSLFPQTFTHTASYFIVVLLTE